MNIVILQSYYIIQNVVCGETVYDYDMEFDKLTLRSSSASNTSS